ncbi:MAG: glycosyltransferase [Deltaproteobacteria bacterium]|nr:glycosyltransferase [Deltaproteobacteria bacterium]
MSIDAEKISTWASMGSITFYLTLMAACFLQLRRGRRFDTAAEPAMPPGEWPGVTILKPCAGADDELESCLESYFTVQYPNVQLLFGVRSDKDPAFAVIERVRARHPEIESELLITGEGRHVSPKISQMEVLAARAKHELFWLSDSNTRVHPDTLWDMVSRIKQPNSGLVASPIVGGGELTAGAALENLQINCYVAMSTYAIKFFMNRVAVPGKSMLITREALTRVGNWDEIGQYFADDEVLVTSIMDQGFRTHLGAFAVQNVNTSGDVKKFYHRHLRWAQIRWRVIIQGAIAELFVAPLMVLLVNAVVMQSAKGWAMFALGFGLQMSIDWLCQRLVRGRSLEWKYAWVLLARPVLNFGLLVRGLFSGRVAWRGNHLWMGPRARILTEPPLRRSIRALRTALRG